MNTVEFNTSMGKIKGLRMDDGTLSFRGIRYASAERWKYPVPVDAWEGVYDATHFGAACPQMRTFRGESEQTPEPFYYKEFRKGDHYDYDEDCLFLNIWAPEHAENANVILYIHGGAFMGGCGNEQHMMGTAYAKKGDIFVSINYRLAIFGFFAAKALEEESGHTGNYGLYDQLTAIGWVHRHIEEFGGNPCAITLMGQSAGAMSIQQLALSPMSRELGISSIYMASGGGLGREFAKVDPVEDSYAYWEETVKAMGDGPEDWRKLSPAQVFDAMGKSADRNLLLHLCPHVDGRLIPKDPIKAAGEGAFLPVPYLMSSNTEDMLPETLAPMAKEWCRLVNEQGGKAFYFCFGRHLPGDDAGAFHSAELWYTIGNIGACWRPMTDWDRELTKLLTASIDAFAKTGNPSISGLPAWKPYDRDGEYLFFGNEGIEARADRG